jgi:CitMHS family citrate-Mg2+:H+ or citrate-Ca2+:H+ symporter
MQKKRIAMHADSILAVVGLIFAAGIFTGKNASFDIKNVKGILTKAVIGARYGPMLGGIIATNSLILAEAASHYGISPEAIARASIVGQPVHLLSPLVP